ncbi:MAG: 50S ribosomal protein L22 [Planctomycetaceae bacterium]|nr:50S ribosomal protein L22 [Planctomycetaceae bacterium]
MALVRATHRYARISPWKVRRFADLIRGMSVENGLNALRYLPNRGARIIEKVLKSAVANCQDRNARNVEKLRIVDARVDGGPMFKRVMPRSRGQANIIHRRLAHVHVAIDAPEVKSGS